MQGLSDATILSYQISQLACRAAVDGQFRQLCLADGTGAYRIMYGEDLPEVCRVRFVEWDAEPEPDGFPCYLLPRFLPPTWLD